MEIEENMCAPNGNISKNLESSSINQYVIEKEAKNKKILKNNAYNELLDRITKSTKCFKEPNSRYSDSIILRSSYDKIKRSNEQNSTFYKTNSINKDTDMNEISEFLKESDKNDINTNNNDSRKKVIYVNNIYQEEIKYSNKNNETSNNYNDNNMAQNEKGNKILSNFNVFDSVNISNNIQKYEQEYTNDKNNKNNNNYYNPFIQNNDNRNNSSFKYSGAFNKNQIKNHSFTLPNITLKALDKNKNDEKDGIFSGFLNIFSKNKKKSANKNEEENQANNNLETIDQKIQSEPYFNNNQQINLHEEKNNKEKNDFVLTSIPTKKGKIDYNDIDKLKNDLISNKEKDNSQGNDIEQNNHGLIVNENIYRDENGNNNNNNNEIKCLVRKEEQPENNMDYNPDDDEEEDENNILGNSSQVIDFDKNSEYTLITGTNIDYLVKKKRKISPLLIAVLLGGTGLIYLIYKNKKVRDMILNLLKVFNIVPELLKGFLCAYGGEIEDFLESYEDMFRLLGFFILLLFFWVTYRLLMKFVVKIWKGKNKF